MSTCYLIKTCIHNKNYIVIICKIVFVWYQSDRSNLIIYVGYIFNGLAE